MKPSRRNLTETYELFAELFSTHQADVLIDDYKH